HGDRSEPELLFYGIALGQQRSDRFQRVAVVHFKDRDRLVHRRRVVSWGGAH
ncbi:hypothetical protein HV823_26440, partial [Rhizobium sp. DBTS2]|nr:hypothetical protein [Rhizobium rhizolycopersici]